MTYFLKKKKWMAWVVLLTFLFTSFMPSNILAGNSVASAEDLTVDAQIVQRGNLLYVKDGTTSLEPMETPDVIMQKSITAGADENEFNITLQVKTPENLENIPSSAGCGCCVSCGRFW